jgi:hypothetical protein
MTMDLPYKRKIMEACGFSRRASNRRTFDRRLVTTISEDIKNRITVIGELFVYEKIVDHYVLSTDSTLIKAKGYVWHKSSMIKEGVIPCSGINTDAMWEFSYTKGWIFGYILHLILSTVPSLYHSQQIYNCQYTGQSDVQNCNMQSTCYNHQKNIIHVYTSWL